MIVVRVDILGIVQERSIYPLVRLSNKALVCVCIHWDCRSETFTDVLFGGHFGNGKMRHFNIIITSLFYIPIRR